MPSPSKRYSQRSSPSRNRGNSNSDNETEMNQRKNSGPSSSRGVKFSADGSTTSRLPSSNNNNPPSSNNEQQMDIGKRTGIQIPARGTSQSIPINNDGYEDLDKFFAAGTSPAPPGLSSSNNNNGAATGGAGRGGGNKKQSDKEQRNQEKHVRHEELLKEGSANARQRPDLLNNEQVSLLFIVFVWCCVAGMLEKLFWSVG